MYKFNWAKDFVTNKKVVSKFTLHSAHKNVVSKEEFSKLLWAKYFVTIQHDQHATHLKETIESFLCRNQKFSNKFFFFFLKSNI